MGLQGFPAGKTINGTENAEESDHDDRVISIDVSSDRNLQLLWDSAGEMTEDNFVSFEEAKRYTYLLMGYTTMER